jgi:hypothetical protein
MKKRKREEEGDDEVGEQQALPPTEPLKTKSPSKKGKSKKTVELFKRPPATSPINVSTATRNRKYHGVASSM